MTASPTTPFMQRMETPRSAPAVVLARASVSATTPDAGTSPGLLTVGIGLFTVGALAGGFVLRRRRRGGGSATGVTIAVDPNAPTTLDAFDLALYELISETKADAGATASSVTVVPSGDDRELSRS